MNWPAIAVTVVLVAAAAYPTSKLMGRINRRFNVPPEAQYYLFQLVGFIVVLGILLTGYLTYSFVRAAFERALS